MEKQLPFLYILPPGRDIFLSFHIFRTQEKYIDKTKDSEDEGSIENDESLILDASRHVLYEKS